MPPYLGRHRAAARPSGLVGTALVTMTAALVGATGVATARAVDDPAAAPGTTAPQGSGGSGHPGSASTAAWRALSQQAAALQAKALQAQALQDQALQDQVATGDHAPTDDAGTRRAPAEGTPRPEDAAAKAASPASASRGQRAASRSGRVTLGPRATLARTPAARSVKTVRVAAQAFPDFTQFTWVGPVTGTHQTSGFGQRWGRLHAGLDFGGPVGTRLKALSGGVVTFAGHQGGYGNKVEVMHWDGSLVVYGHMSSIAVKRGQKVEPGTVVGRLGNSGHSTGPHLHLEVRPGGGAPIDPWPWLVQRGILPRDMPRH